MRKRIFSYLFLHKKLFIASLLFMLINASATLAPAEWGGSLLKQLLKTHAFNKLPLFALIALGIFSLKFFADFMRRFLMGMLGQKICVTMQRQFHNKLLYLPIHFFKKNRSGELLSRATNDIALLREFFGSHMISFISDPIILIAGLTRLLLLNWIFTLELIAAGIIIGVLMHWVGNFLRRVINSMQEKLGDMTAAIQNALYAINIIKIFSRSKYHKQQFDNAAQEYMQHATSSVRLKAIFRPLVDFIGFIGVLAIIATGTMLISSQQMKVDQLFTFIFYIGILSSPLNALTGFYMQYKTAEAASLRFFEIIDEPEQSDQGKKKIDKVRGDVCYKKIAFNYTEKEKALNNINCTIKAGETVAIVGRSGSGKTTFANLLPRLIEPATGTITIDGHNTQNIELTSLRNHISMVTQENILLPGTIHENIAYGNLEATTTEIIQAAKTAQAHTFIQKLPKKYETQISEYGANLSGGQRQRIAIARAILKKPAILILDEATSALDSVSERLVQKALAALIHKQTTIIIAHRLSTVKQADTIIVMEKGKIVEQGSHKELYSKKESLYRKLYKTQFHE